MMALVGAIIGFGLVQAGVFLGRKIERDARRRRDGGR